MSTRSDRLLKEKANGERSHCPLLWVTFWQIEQQPNAEELFFHYQQPHVSANLSSPRAMDVELQILKHLARDPYPTVAISFFTTCLFRRVTEEG